MAMIGELVGFIIANIIELVWMWHCWFFSSVFTYKESTDCPNWAVINWPITWAKLVDIMTPPKVPGKDDPVTVMLADITWCVTSAVVVAPLWRLLDECYLQGHMSKPAFTLPKDANLDMYLKPVWGVASDFAFDVDPIKEIRPSRKGTVMGIVGQAPWSEWIQPSVPLFGTPFPTLTSWAMAWDRDSKTGRVVVAYAPIAPLLIGPVVLRPFASQGLLRLWGWINWGSMMYWTQPATAQPGSKEPWMSEYADGVKLSTRMVSDEVLNLFFGWCAKLCLSLTGVVTKSAPPMPKFLWNKLKKLGLLRMVTFVLRYLMPVDTAVICEGTPAFLVPEFIGTVAEEIWGYALPPKARGLPLIGGAIRQAATQAHRIVSPNLKIVSAPSSGWPGWQKATAEEKDNPHAVHGVVLQTPLTDIASRVTPGYPLVVDLTQANETGFIIGMSTYASGLANFIGTATINLYLSRIWTEAMRFLWKAFNITIHFGMLVLTTDPSALADPGTVAAAWFYSAVFAAPLAVAIHFSYDMVNALCTIMKGEIPTIDPMTYVWELMTYIFTFVLLWSAALPGFFVMVWVIQHCPPVVPIRTPSAANGTALPEGLIRAASNVYETYSRLTAEIIMDVRRAKWRYIEQDFPTPKGPSPSRFNEAMSAIKAGRKVWSNLWKKILSSG